MGFRVLGSSETKPPPLALTIYFEQQHLLLDVGLSTGALHPDRNEEFADRRHFQHWKVANKHLKKQKTNVTNNKNVFFVKWNECIKGIAVKVRNRW